MSEIIENSWQWIVTTAITIISVLIAYFSYKKKTGKSNQIKSGNNSINIQSSKNVKINKDKPVVHYKKGLLIPLKSGILY